MHMMQCIVIKNTLDIILFDYGRVVEEDAGNQIPKLCNEVDPDEAPLETTRKS